MNLPKPPKLMFDKFIGVINNPFSFRFFMLRKLPSAYFSGVRVRYTDEEKCVVTIPYKWFSRNPFGSLYFASMSMAAEMSTGVLAMGHCYTKDPAVSMLVTKVEGSFIIKAKGKITFTCDDGLRMASMIRESIATGKGTSINAYSTGKDEQGDSVADFIITWSFKVKMPKTKA